MTTDDALVSTEWLADRLDAPDLRIVDASWHLPDTGRDAQREYDGGHIPGAVFFDIDDIADTASGFPHAMPSPEKFSSRVRKLGLGDGGQIVAYDTGNWMAAARVWWMFHVYGHQDVSVLDGGLAQWRAAGRPLSDAREMPRDRHFTARMNTLLLRDLDQVRANLGGGREQLLDVRSPGRFSGAEPEPRPGLRGGHIPGSLNLPFSDLFDATSRKLLDGDALKAKFAAVGVDLGRPVVTSCGSGVTACVAALALHLVGHRDIALYDGSWAEWGSRDDTPIET